MKWPEQINQVVEGDNIESLRDIPDGSVHCVVTSPPYFGLRQYLFDKSVVLRYDIDDEKKKEILQELEKRGIKPRM